MIEPVTEPTNVMIKAPLQMARDERESLVPIVGAGISLPLGLPDWQRFVANLSKKAVKEVEEVEPPDLLAEIKSTMGETAFVAAVQQQLSLPTNSTTTTLQALASASIKKIITTNLDLAIEIAFVKAGKPLNPANVGKSCSIEELSLFDRHTDEPILLKIHGSIERPSTWVLTREQYDAAYVEPGHLKDFLSTKIPIPLFIGFSFSDFDVNESLRIARLTQRKKAYTIIQIKQARTLASRFKNLGIIPIGFFLYDQIPEIIDEIFGCSPLTVSIERPYGKPLLPKLRVGGAEIGISPSMTDKTVDKVVSVLANAFEVQPNRSIVTGKPRREHGQKGTYRDDVVKVLTSNETDVLEVLFKGFVQYPDTFFESLTNSILKKEELIQYNYFKIFFDCFPHGYEAERMEQVVLSNLHNPDLGYKCLRDIAKIAAARDIHPALGIPPHVVTVGSLKVSVYLLTRYQVESLRGKEPRKIKHPLRPYTIQSISEAPEIIEKLNKNTGLQWRLPSEQEWLSIASVSASNPWPWGEDEPQYKVHAHLRYIDQGGNVSEHPLEVGIFPKGKSVTNLYDIIGNTYELVVSNGGYRLAGGAWTTSFKPGSNFSLIRGWSTGKDNIGIRPVCNICTNGAG